MSNRFTLVPMIGCAALIAWLALAPTSASAAVPAESMAAVPTAMSAAEPDFGPSAQTATMTFHYDAAIAAAHGYEVRMDSDGYEYAVPAGTPIGSTVGATPRAPSASMRAAGGSDGGSSGGSGDETVSGDCGTATLTFTSRTRFETAYTIFPQWGFALGHRWSVAVVSSIDAQSFNLDGVPALFSFDWEAEQEIDVQALPGQRLSGLAGGTTTTVVGDCVAANPTDSIAY